MRIWTVVNQKGGVGKTTTTISLAGALVSQGYRVLLVDMDPHASLTYYLQVNDILATVYDIFLSQPGDDLSTFNTSTRFDSIDIIGGSESLATLDRHFGQASGKGLVIKKALGQFSQQYDFAILDCPPVLGVLMVNAMVAADNLIIPTQTEHLSMQGLSSMLNSVSLLTPSMQKNVDIKVVATMFDKRLKACQSAYKTLRNDYLDYLWRGYIPVDTKFRLASEMGLPINLLAPTSRGSFAYEKLCNDLLRTKK